MAASSKIPALSYKSVSERARKILDIVEKFVEEECVPAETIFQAQLAENNNRWGTPSILEDLKVKAKALGLWNMFLAKGHYQEGAGFSNVEYGLMCEYLGRSFLASEATNNSAPDTGNMEVLAKYGTEAQKKQWLVPLLAGKIRSAFVMTEPGVASSDATNVKLTIEKSGNDYILNGEKWWISSAGDPRCKLYIVIGQTDPGNPDVHRRQSIILVPAGMPGITVERMLSVYGFDDAPQGHGHLNFKNVRVPSDNIILGIGRGFEVLQGRMGPGRIHHAMRCIGGAERALEWMLSRANDERKRPFGKLLSEHGVILEWIAKSRIEIDSARLIVLNAAAKIDETNAKDARTEIAEAKILVPSMACTVIDRAVQAFGAAGICQDTPLAFMWAQIRTVRIADGPDEVHLQQMGRYENKRGIDMQKKLEKQSKIVDKLFTEYGTKRIVVGSRL